MKKLLIVTVSLICIIINCFAFEEEGAVMEDGTYETFITFDDYDELLEIFIKYIGVDLKGAMELSERLENSKWQTEDALFPISLHKYTISINIKDGLLKVIEYKSKDNENFCRMYSYDLNSYVEN